jgi:hypothetical protein
MIAFVKKLIKDRRGNALAIACAALPLVVGSAGLAVDTIQWTLWKRQLQRASDSAAMAGVYTRIKTNTQAAVSAAVTHDETLNLHTWMDLSAAPTVELLADSGQMKYQVRVTYTVRQALPFSSLFMSAAPTIKAVSTAASVPGGGEYCVIGLDPSAKATGITISGSTYLDLGDCSLIANSTNPTQAASNGTSGNGGSGSTVKAASLAAAGGVNYSANWSVGSYNPYSSPVDDPFAAYQSNIPSSSSACTKTASINKSGNTTDFDRRTTDTAGQIVCMNGSQTIQGKVQLGPATYVINAGDLTMTSSNSGVGLSCTGCTIILTNFSNPASTGSVKLTGGTLQLSPPTPASADGTTAAVGNQTWKGIVLYQDPRATDNGNLSSPQNQINGNSATSLQGVVYFGNQSLTYNGGGKDVAACLQVVAKRVTFGGNSLIKAASQCGNWGLSTVGGGRRVRLVA